MEETLYFSYGSNIDLKQMAVRCPAATPVRPVVLDNYRLAFRGNLGFNGVATILPARSEKVYGLLWRITPADERALDRYEGYPNLYGKERITVRDRDGNTYTVMAYIMTREHIREPAEPSEPYFQGIVNGYRENGLPARPLFEALQRTRIELAELDAQSFRPEPNPPWKPRSHKKSDPQR